MATCHDGDLAGDHGEGRLDGVLAGKNSLPLRRDLLLSSLNESPGIALSGVLAALLES